MTSIPYILKTKKYTRIIKNEQSAECNQETKLFINFTPI